MESGRNSIAIVRAAEPNDILSILALERKSTEVSNWSERAYLEAIHSQASERATLVCEVEGTVAAFVVARIVGSDCELESILVAPEYRRGGIASGLIKRLTILCRERSATKIFLEVRESNSGARAFYGRIGFAETGKRKAYYRDPQEDAVLYTLRL